MLGNPKTALITVIMVICWQFAPFVFMVLNSFKQKFEMLVSGVFSPPERLDFSNYVEALHGNFLHYFTNSVIVLAVSLVILLFVSACASYPLSRFHFRLRIGFNQAYYDHYTLDLFFPIYDINYIGEKRGMLCMSFNDTSLNQVLAYQDSSMHSSLAVIDSEGMILAASDLGKMGSVMSNTLMMGQNGIYSKDGRFYLYQRIANWPFYVVSSVEQVKEEQHQMEQIRFNALQSQINPHFLYNTLECVHWQTEADGNKEISTLVKALARCYIEEHPTQDISVASIAASLYVSPNYFSLAFKKHTGRSPTQYREDSQPACHVE